MKLFFAREYMDGSDWRDALRVQGADAHEAAENYARYQCGQDPATYSSYESGRFVEVREKDADTSTLVSVSVSFDPHFSSRIERTLTLPPEETDSERS